MLPIRLLFAAAVAFGTTHARGETAACPEYLNTEMRRLHSQETANLCDFYKVGKPMVIVNTASHCGFTKQFGGLEKLHQKYKDQGLVVLGFPSNSFNQEEKSEEGTARVAGPPLFFASDDQRASGTGTPRSTCTASRPNR